MKAENAWQDAAGRRWAALQEQTDAQLGPLGREAMALVAPARGERVLDVGCGAGQSTLELAERVGPEGRVLALDISEPLLESARERVERAGIEHVRFLLGNAATEPLEPAFDLVFSRFGVMFFEDAVAAFTHLRAALVPGGRLGFVCWQARELNAWAQAPLMAAQRLRPECPLSALLEPGKPGPFYFAEPAFVQEVLERAGFSAVRVMPRSVEVPVGGARTLAEAVSYTRQIGPASRFIADAGLDDDPRVNDALAASLAPYASARGVVVPACILLVTAAR